ncbi:hypothetical protein ACQEU6_36525 [Spirillospora sp. CA-108201]
MARARRRPSWQAAIGAGGCPRSASQRPAAISANDSAGASPDRRADATASAASARVREPSPSARAESAARARAVPEPPRPLPLLDEDRGEQRVRVLPLLARRVRPQRGPDEPVADRDPVALEPQQPRRAGRVEVAAADAVRPRGPR